MSKFCVTCGAQLEDNATFCTSCGASQTAQPNNQNTSNAQSGGNPADLLKNINADSIKDALTIDSIKNLPKNPNPITIAALAVCAIVLVIIIGIIATVAGSGYKKPIDGFTKALEKGDTKYLEDCFCNEELEYLADKHDLDEGHEYYEDTLDFLIEALEYEYGDNIKVSYKIEKKSNLSKAKLKDYRKDLEDRYDEDIEVTKGYKVKVKLKIKGKDDKDEDTSTFEIIKVNGKWCFASSGEIL